MTTLTSNESEIRPRTARSPRLAPSEEIDALVRVASSSRVHHYLLDVFDRIEGDDYLEDDRRRLTAAIHGGAAYWDICCVLAAFALIHRPARYLEIGVRRGRSACVVAAFAPRVDLFLFDMWAENYAGVPNPGPGFVENQLRRVGHRGSIHFITGRSQETVPSFLAEPENPRTFDLITVDGDHRDDGARRDLGNVVDHLAPGGLFVFDDIAHQQFPTLRDVWWEFVDRHPELITRENTTDSTGTAIALRP